MKKLLLLFVTLLSANHISAQSSANGYMVDAVWSQGYPYNIFCPSLANGNKALTGCGATAMAQIFYYYQFPLKGTGHVKYGNVDVDLDACAIDWQHIQPRYGAQASETEKEAVANLMRVVGAAMKMHYMTNGSSPYNYPSMMWGLQHYLHLSPQSRYLRRCYYSTAEWMEMLCKELDEGHPVFYRGDHSEPDKSLAGHMFVVDGHDGTSLFHANYGHGEDYQIRWVDLNLLNQGNGTNPGVGGVCYHHRQAMVTDCVPMQGLSDSDFDPIALVVDTTLFVGDDPYASTVVARNSVYVNSVVKLVSFFGASIDCSVGFYRDGVLQAVSPTVLRSQSFPDGGRMRYFRGFFTLPSTLGNGEYEMNIVSRENESAPWVRGWDNAPNRVPVTVENGTFTFHVLPSHKLDTHLYLLDGIKEVTGQNGGKTFEFTICNPSENNFEDSLRICISNKGKTYLSHQLTSIYDGQQMTYRYFIPDTKADFSEGYEISAFYRELNGKRWLPLTDYATAVRQQDVAPVKGLTISTLGGVCVRRWSTTPGEQEYANVLRSLPKGVYVIQDANGSRKFVKSR
ncbi:MAG: C10 family peptidase [Prevotella sp.]|nr:C10 family peptidase [Prevotella sp.]